MLNTEEEVSTYKRLARAERAFRRMKTSGLQIPPIRHSNDDCIRAHVFLCMLACYVERHMRDRLRDLMSVETDQEDADASRETVVGQAQRSGAAREKEASMRTPDGVPVQSFRGILNTLRMLTRNRVRCGSSGVEYIQLSEPRDLQQRYLERLDVTV